MYLGGCESLKEITISETVTSIGNECFSYCYSLVSLTLSPNLTSLGSLAFESSGFPTIVLPNSLNEILGYTLSFCKNLKAVTLPDKITHIRAGAFQECYSLPSIKLPSTVKFIGEKVFFHCEQTLLKSIFRMAFCRIKTKTFEQMFVSEIYPYLHL